MPGPYLLITFMVVITFPYRGCRILDMRYNWNGLKLSETLHTHCQIADETVGIIGGMNQDIRILWYLVRSVE